MEKKKLKLSISGSSKKTLNSIEQAKSQSKNTVVIEKKNSKFPGKSQFSRQNVSNLKTNNNNYTKPNNFVRPKDIKTNKIIIVKIKRKSFFIKLDLHNKS